MSGPHGADPTQGGGFAEQPTTQTPWQAPSAWQQPVPAADQATSVTPTPQAPSWGQPPVSSPGQPDPAATAYPPQGAAYGQQPQPGYAAPAAPTYQAPPPVGGPAYGQPGSGGYPGYGAAPAPAGYPQYGAQSAAPYGPPPQYGVPGQSVPGAPGAPGPEGAKSKKNVIVIGGAVAAVVVAGVLITGFWKPGFLVTTTLDMTKAQQGVQQILTDDTNGYGAKNVKDVKCNNGENKKIVKDQTFTCEVSIDGAKRQVTVTFTDDKGTYEVGRPK